MKPVFAVDAQISEQLSNTERGPKGGVKLPVSYRPPQGRDVLIVLLKSSGEVMATVSVGDKIKVLRLRRVECGFQRTSPRIRNRPGRKSGMTVGVVR